MPHNRLNQPSNCERNVSAQADGLEFGIHTAIFFFESLDGVEAPDKPVPAVQRQGMLCRFTVILNLLYSGTVNDAVAMPFVYTRLLRNIFALDCGGHKWRLLQ